MCQSQASALWPLILALGCSRLENMTRGARWHSWPVWLDRSVTLDETKTRKERLHRLAIASNRDLRRTSSTAGGSVPTGRPSDRRLAHTRRVTSAACSPSIGSDRPSLRQNSGKLLSLDFAYHYGVARDGHHVPDDRSDGPAPSPSEAAQASSMTRVARLDRPRARDVEGGEWRRRRCCRDGRPVMTTFSGLIRSRGRGE